MASQISWRQKRLGRRQKPLGSYPSLHTSLGFLMASACTGISNVKAVVWENPRGHCPGVRLGKPTGQTYQRAGEQGPSWVAARWGCSNYRIQNLTLILFAGLGIEPRALCIIGKDKCTFHLSTISGFFPEICMHIQASPCSPLFLLLCVNDTIMYTFYLSVWEEAPTAGQTDLLVFCSLSTSALLTAQMYFTTCIGLRQALSWLLVFAGFVFCREYNLSHSVFFSYFGQGIFWFLKHFHP
jgi:hypothetical protein